MNRALYFLLAAALTACGNSAPISLSECSVALVETPKPHVVYRIRYTNVSDRTIAVSRLGFMPWTLSGSPLPDNATGLIYDDKVTLGPRRSHTAEVSTGNIDTHQHTLALQKRLGEMDCKAVAVRFIDDSIWSAHHGFAVP